MPELPAALAAIRDDFLALDQRERLQLLLEFSNSLPDLPEKMKESGVVPAGFLIERSGMRGTRHGGAMVGRRHANFVLNVGGATATEIRQLAGLVSRRVLEKFDVVLEEEVLFLGDWSSYREAWED